jgi:hypothetical protein
MKKCSRHTWERDEEMQQIHMDHACTQPYIECVLYLECVLHSTHTADAERDLSFPFPGIP